MPVFGIFSKQVMIKSYHRAYSTDFTVPILVFATLFSKRSQCFEVIGGAMVISIILK